MKKYKTHKETKENILNISSGQHTCSAMIGTKCLSLSNWNAWKIQTTKEKKNNNSQANQI